ncbi:MAG: hypothetical protein ABIY55_20520, partial [Kofleriaceae bacterium]
RSCDAVSLAALALLVVVTLLARRTVASPVLARLRALLPSWRFFDRAVASPALWIRLAGDGDRDAAWQPIAPPARPWTRWAFAPAGNLALAYHAIVEQLVAELGELELEATGDADPTAPLAAEADPQVVGLVSYELVTRVARAHVPPGHRFQWKITVPGDPAPADYVLSPVIA